MECRGSVGLVGEWDVKTELKEGTGGRWTDVKTELRRALVEGQPGCVCAGQRLLLGETFPGAGRNELQTGA